MRYFWAATLLAACIPVQAADRAGLTVSPVSVFLDATQQASAVTLSNGSSVDKVIQVDLVSWQHVDGEDKFVPTDDLLVNPPMFRLHAGASQIVRLGLSNPQLAAPAQEKTYRLFLQEVPETAPDPGVTGTGLRLVLRLGVPVFLSPAQPQPEALQWKLSRGTDGGLRLQLANAGNRHARISELKVVSGGKGAAVRPDGFAYVFAGETLSWKLKPRAPWQGRSATVSARTDDGVVHVDLPLDRP